MIVSLLTKKFSDTAALSNIMFYVTMKTGKSLTQERTLNMLLFQAIVEQLETEDQIRTAEDIFENYQNAMFRAAYRILDNTDDAEEAVGDAIVKICRHIDNFIGIPENSRRLLVKKYTEHTAIDKWRERKRKPTESLNDYIFNTTDSGGDVFGKEDEIIFEGEELGILQEYVKELPQKYRDILILKYVSEMKNKEIAELMHISASTVSTHISRAMHLLKKMLNEERN